MKTAIQDLVTEHKAILIALSILERMKEKAEKDKKADFNEITELIEFLKEFADKCHHGKEEGLLFPALEKAGIRNEGGPIGVMLAEHEKGRKFIKAMQTGINAGPAGIRDFVGAASEYINLLRVHIMKENTVLFPQIEIKLTQQEQNELLENFENHEEKVIGQGRHEELHSMLEKFSRKYLG